LYSFNRLRYRLKFILKLYSMNYQQVVSVCSHTGLVILLVASHSSNPAIYKTTQPETKVIVIKESRVAEQGA
jgi:hypothetical protein